MKKQTIALITLLILVNACSDNNDNTQLVETAEKDTYVQPRSEPNPDKNAYFGDLHVHTSNSFDA